MISFPRNDFSNLCTSEVAPFLRLMVKCKAEDLGALNQLDLLSALGVWTYLTCSADLGTPNWPGNCTSLLIFAKLSEITLFSRFLHVISIWGCSFLPGLDAAALACHLQNRLGAFS